MKAKYIDKSLVAFGIADAYGAGFEFQPLDWVHENFEWDYKTPRWDGTEVAMYTDDTQMSIANTLVILNNSNPSAEDFADSYVTCYQRDKRLGYAKRFQNFLDGTSEHGPINNGKDFIEKIIPTSSRNGGDMRAMVLGIFKDWEKVSKLLLMSTALTHNSSKCQASTHNTAAIAHYVFHGLGSREDVFNYCINRSAGFDDEATEHFKKVSNLTSINTSALCGEDRNNKGIPCDGVKTSAAIMYLVYRYWDDPLEGLKQSILLGGDTDSVASSVYGILAARNGMENIPQKLYDNFENNIYGRDYLEDLGKRWAGLSQ